MTAIKTRLGPRRRSISVWTALVATAIGLVLVLPAAASHSEVSLAGSNFEIDSDANIKVDDASPSLDWANVSETRKQDTQSGASDEAFGQGTKEDTAVPAIVDGSIPPNKSDLKFFGIYQEGTSGSGFLNLFWSRVQDPTGTTNMDFEFNKRQCTPNQTPADSDCSANGVTPLRSPGDLLVIYDLSQGGTKPTLSLREWGGSSWGAPTDLTASNKATGSINTSPIPAADSDGLGAHSARTFGEAQIALSAIFSSTSCQSFGSAYLKSRSSDSFTAAVKDFVPPVGVSITNCGKLTIVKQDDLSNALNGAGFTLYPNNAPTAAPRGAEDVWPAGVTAPTCTTGDTVAGQCEFTNVAFGDYWVVETTVPAGHTGVADQAVTLTPANSPLTVGPLTDNRNPASVKVKKVDDDDPANPISDVTFDLWVDNGSTAATTGPPDGSGPKQDSHGAEDTKSAYSCSTDATGVCTISNILDPGNYWIVEDSTTLPAGYDAAPDQYVQVALGNDYGATTPFTFVDPRQFTVIVLVCQESTGKLYPSSVTFQDSAKTSLAAAGLPAGVTESEACSLGGARYENKHYGDHNDDDNAVNIPR